jgi:hypothetical protein
MKSCQILVLILLMAPLVGVAQVDFTNVKNIDAPGYLSDPITGDFNGDGRQDVIRNSANPIRLGCFIRLASIRS